jgi:hypothetical protein
MTDEQLLASLRDSPRSPFCTDAGKRLSTQYELGLSPLAAYIVALVIGVLIRRARPRRSRYISARAKRQAIAKWEKETGQTFNRRLHELDHILAHSRGRGNAEGNIRVLTRKQNRSKGAQSQ